MEKSQETKKPNEEINFDCHINFFSDFMFFLLDFVMLFLFGFLRKIGFLCSFLISLHIIFAPFIFLCSLVQIFLRPCFLFYLPVSVFFYEADGAW